MGNVCSGRDESVDTSTGVEERIGGRRRDVKSDADESKSDKQENQLLLSSVSSISQVQTKLRKCGLENSHLMLGVDFTKSNEWTGKHSFFGKCLHEINSCDFLNPYEQSIDVISRTLAEFDRDNQQIPCYGFGDARTCDNSLFSFLPRDEPCIGLDTVRNAYRAVVPNVTMSGPTSFAPIINQAISLVNATGQYYILVILADGQVTRSVDIPDGKLSQQEMDTMHAIVRASFFPMSIIVVGVGDGPWGNMKLYDDHLTNRCFDNFHFVCYNDVMSTVPSPDSRDAYFAVRTLAKIPDQYRCIRKLKLLDKQPGHFLKGYNFGVSIYPPPTASSEVENNDKEDEEDEEEMATEVKCKACTFLNPVGNHMCTMCSTLFSPLSSPTSPPSHDFVEANNTPENDTSSIEPNDHISRELANMREEVMCLVCFDKRKNVAFGCGHQTCFSCSESLEECPVCRQPIETKIRLYS